MKQILLNYYVHDMDYAEWFKSPAFNDMGFHKLKDNFGTYIKLGTTVCMLNAPDANLLKLFEYTAPAPQVSTPAPTIGISEDTLLVAIAIAQDPKLAMQLMAIRKSV